MQNVGFMKVLVDFAAADTGCEFRCTHDILFRHLYTVPCLFKECTVFCSSIEKNVQPIR